MFIWENPNWPRFTWDRQKLEGPLAEVHRKQGGLLGRIEALGLGAHGLEASSAPNAGNGEIDTITDTQNPLTAERLLTWYATLFPERRAAWRKDDIAGAPPAERLALETTVFLHWFNGSQLIDPVLKAGLAHLWFATIRPFEGGNRRIAGAITDRTLAKAGGGGERTNMAAQISKERAAYDIALDAAQRGTPDITDWLVWFLGYLARSLEVAQSTLASVLEKSRFWDQHRATAFNDRQRKVLTLLQSDFEGKLTTSKWAKLTACSQDTAYRDILDLMTKNILVKEDSGGRSTSYRLQI